MPTLSSAPTRSTKRRLRRPLAPPACATGLKTGANWTGGGGGGPRWNDGRLAVPCIEPTSPCNAPYPPLPSLLFRQPSFCLPSFASHLPRCMYLRRLHRPHPHPLPTFNSNETTVPPLRPTDRVATGPSRGCTLLRGGAGRRDGAGVEPQVVLVGSVVLYFACGASRRRHVEASRHTGGRVAQPTPNRPLRAWRGPRWVGIADESELERRKRAQSSCVYIST